MNQDLGRLREQLGELLSLLEDEHAEPATLARAMQSCGVVFEALKAGFPALEELEQHERERLAEELESTLRLNAVALSRATTTGENLVAGISRSKQARKHARALASESTPGTTCDLSV